MLKDSLASNTNNAPKTFKIGYQSLKILWYNFIWFYKHVQTCHNAYDAIWYDSQTCPDLS